MGIKTRENSDFLLKTLFRFYTFFTPDAVNSEAANTDDEDDNSENKQDKDDLSKKHFYDPQRTKIEKNRHILKKIIHM